MPSTMRAAVFVEKGRIVLEEKPIPRPGPGESQVRVRTTAIRGTDVHILKGEYPVRRGSTVGHEPVGRVPHAQANLAPIPEGLSDEQVLPCPDATQRDGALKVAITPRGITTKRGAIECR